MYRKSTHADELLGRQVDEELPERLALELRPEVPDRVDNGCGREMDHALLRAEPAELAVRHEAAPEAAHVGPDPVEALAHDERLEGMDRGDADLGAPAARERQPVTVDPVVTIGAQDHVRGGVVRIGVHRVGPVEPARRREADVVRLEPDDRRAAHSPRQMDKYPISLPEIRGSATTTAGLWAQRSDLCNLQSHPTTEEPVSGGFDLGRERGDEREAGKCLADGDDVADDEQRGAWQARRDLGDLAEWGDHRLLIVVGAS